MQKNLHFWAFWPKMAHFEQVLAKMGDTGFFFKKALGKFFPPLQALTNCKVSEKSNERISRKAVADGRTNERTRAKFKVLLNSSTNQKLALKHNYIQT